LFRSSEGRERKGKGFVFEVASSSSASEGYAELTAEVTAEDAGVVNREACGVGKALFGRRASLLFARPFILVGVVAGSLGEFSSGVE